MSTRKSSFFILSILVSLLVLSHYGKAFAAGPNISSMQVTNLTTTSANITWTTDSAATSQVIQLDNDDYSTAYKRFPEPYDSTLVTSHSVTMSNLVPGTKYSMDIVSIDGNGNAASTKTTPTIFTTLAVDTTATTTYRIDTTGPQNVSAGSDLYFKFTPIALSGVIAAPFFLPLYQVTGLPASITALVICEPNGNPANEAGDNWSGGCYDASGGSIRLRTSAATPPGSYTATITAKDAAGVTATYTYPFNVTPAPAPTVRTAPSSFPPIPGLQLWQSYMLTLGNQWCQHDASNNISLGYEGDDWYYDGGRVFLQIADYTGDYAKWVPCAQKVLGQYGALVNTNNGQIQRYEKFPFGLMMNYLRYNDPTSKQAVINLDNTSYLELEYGESVTPVAMRELAYAIDDMVAGQEIGQSQNVFLPVAINSALNQIDEEYVSNPWQFDQPFMGGLLAESLITYYDNISPDPRIPPAIKSMLDWYWNNAVNHTTGQTTYNPLYVPPYYFYSLNNLLDPAYAWYWNLTGNNAYQQEGDLLFQHDMDVDASDDITYNGKIFSQTFKWSFDYVRWRSGVNSSAIDASSNPAAVARTSPAIISSLATSGLTNNAVIIAWTTDEPASTLINYGLTSSYGLATTLVSTLVTSHGQALTGLSPGTTYHYQAQSTDGWGNMTKSADYTFTTSIASTVDTSFTPIRINAGGAQYADSQGNTWNADANYLGGTPLTGGNNISGPDSLLYTNQRTGINGASFSYQFSGLPNGNYYVGLKFGEVYYSDPSHRIFNISINGVPVANNFMFSAIGAPIDATYLGVVTNGTLTIQFTPVSSNAVVSAIQLVKASSVSTPAGTGSGGGSGGGSGTSAGRSISLSSLEGLSSIPAGTSINASVIAPTTQTILSTQSLSPSATGTYVVTFQPSFPQVVSIRVSANGYLSQLLTNIDTTVNSSVVLVVPQLLAGDFNNDNTVNSLDYSSMNSHWLQSFATADINRDSLVNSLDFAVLKNDFGKIGQ